MWRSRRKSSREIDDIDGFIRTSSSKLTFIHSSLKDVENLFADDDDNDNRFSETLYLPSPCSTAAAARRLSIFHRVHLANKFARAFSTKQIHSPNKSPPESKNLAAAEKFTKSERSPPESNNVAAAEKLTKSEKSLPESNNAAAAEKLTKSDKSPPESNNVATAEKLTKSEKSPPESKNLAAAEKSDKLEKSAKSDRVILIPGAEKRVVVYTTSLRVVRPTFEACRSVQSILRGFRVSIDERDLSMDSKFLDELLNIMAEGGEDEVEKRKLTLPRVFIGGRYVGGAEEVKQLHETGELKKFVEGLPAVTAGECEGCGDLRFILCDECSGSHKCYTEKGGFRSCTLCNENGLIRCPSCLGR